MLVLLVIILTTIMTTTTTIIISVMVIGVSKKQIPGIEQASLLGKMPMKFIRGNAIRGWDTDMMREGERKRREAWEKHLDCGDPQSPVKSHTASMDTQCHSGFVTPDIGWKQPREVWPQCKSQHKWWISGLSSWGLQPVMPFEVWHLQMCS